MQRTSLNLSDAAAREMTRRGGTAESRSKSGTATEMLERYAYIMQSGRAELASREIFSPAELTLICDALNGTSYQEVWLVGLMPDWIEDAIRLSGLARKPDGVDGPALVAKLKALSLPDKFALLDGVEIFCQRVKAGEQPEPGEVLR